MHKPLLGLTNLCIERGDVRILDRINWKVYPGEHWVILGPNGCGKTSLLRCILGYLSETSGELELLGKRHGEWDWRELRLRVGIVSSALHASIPAGEPAIETVVSGKYAQLDLWHAGTPADNRAAAKWLKCFGIENLAGRAWLYLSQGERQRVLIARALMAKPALLILDEPCSGLDPVARADFLNFIETLMQQRGCPSLVLVTHHVEEITPSFTHGLVLANGRVVAADTVKRVVTSKVLSACLGAQATVSRASGEYRLRLRNAPKRRRV